MKYSVYLFDFDYTLVDSEEGIVGCYHRTINELGYEKCSDDILKSTIALTMHDAVAKVTGSDDEAEIARFIDCYRRYADIYMTPGTTFYPDAIPTIRTLCSRGAKAAIISTKTRHRIQEKLDADGVSDLFEFVIGVDDVKSAKPAPDGINLAAERLLVPKSSILYVGDNPVDAGAAKNAGVSFAAVTTGTTPRETFMSMPHIAIMKNLLELIDIR